jgi:hypothetical protein
MRTSWEEAQQSKYESKRSSLPLNSFFTASSTLAGCVTTKPLIDVASLDQLQKQIGVSLLWRSKRQRA